MTIGAAQEFRYSTGGMYANHGFRVFTWHCSPSRANNAGHAHTKRLSGAQL
jgi:hypothetical protein